MLFLTALVSMQGLVSAETPDGIEPDCNGKQGTAAGRVESTEQTFPADDCVGNIMYQVHDGIGLVSGNHHTSLASGTDVPYVVSAAPGDGEKGVGVDTTIEVSFSEEMDQGSVRNATQLIWTDEEDVAHQVMMAFFWTSGGKTLKLTPASDLTGSTEYLLVITAGATDVDGNQLSPEISYTFTTETVREYDTGSGGMINLVALLTVIFGVIVALGVVIKWYLSRPAPAR